MRKCKQTRVSKLFLTLLAAGFLLTSGAFAAKGGNSGSGGKTPKDSGESQSLNCSFIGAGASLSNDTWGEYINGQERAECRTGGTSQPNLSGLRLETLEKGKVTKDRMLLVQLGKCTSNVAEGHDCAALFSQGDPPNILGGSLVEAGFTVRPYPDPDLGFDQSHIQLLSPGLYEMAVRVVLRETSDRWVVNLGSEIFVEDPKFIGALCHNPAGKTEEDASVIVFPDGDGDGFPDSYVVTTGTVTGFNADGSPGNTTFPDGWGITPRSRTASICSNYSGTCGTGAAASDLCDFVGTVALQFTFDAMVIP